VVVALLIMAVATAVSSLSRSVPELGTARFFVGCGIGTVLACIAGIAAETVPTAHRVFGVGILQAAYPLGSMITGFVTAWALPRFGWQHCLIGAAAVCALFVPLVLLVLPAHGADPAAEERPSIAAAIGGARLRSSLLLWVATISGFMALYFVISWITKLAIMAGLPETDAIVASAIYNFGAFAGTVVMSLVGLRLDVRKVCGAMLAAAAGMFLIFGGIHMTLPWVLVTAFLTGFTVQGGYNMLYPIAARMYPDRVRVTGVGWAFGVGRIGAFSGPLIGGWALAQNLPLVVVFGIFCVPLLLAAAIAATLRLD
jgi:MFS family permease